MTRFTTVLGAAALALAIGTAGALAQTTPSTTATKPGTTTTTPSTTTVKKAAVPKVATTEAGKKCSADADAKKLHGAERRKFRRSCVKDFKAGKN